MHETPSPWQAHKDFRGLVDKEHKHSSVCPLVRRFVVLRHPYVHLLSEMLHFPGDFFRRGQDPVCALAYRAVPQAAPDFTHMHGARY